MLAITYSRLSTTIGRKIIECTVAGFQFTVSFKKWIRPNTDNDPEDSLYPDVPVYTTIEDIKQAKDPQLEKLKDIIRKM